MAHKFPPLTVHNIERPDPSTVILVVEHDAAQSYSRAVRPFAFRHAGAAIGAGAGSWTCTGTADRGTVEPDAPIRLGTRCLVGYIFRESGALAREEARAVVGDVTTDEVPECTPEELDELFGAKPERTPTPPLPLLRNYRIVWHLAGDPTTRSTPLTILARELDHESARDVLAGLADVDAARVDVRDVVLQSTSGVA